uniref:AT1G53400 protein n=1 Tax=Arabidopsis thaliana TaxID=3702 RepID=C0Z299_ARATH|nr:AT1G53400 [Arabidopsis thaliana]
MICFVMCFGWLHLILVSTCCVLHLVIAEIWDALRAAAEADISLAQAIVDSAGVIVQNTDLTVCYDERGQNLNLVLLASYDCSSFP